ncbi:MAG: tetratricopeptide repeat protein, partial [Holophagales bacterium]|nr:tetratricopeptide repeat protein [Holophagales bacterium]
MSSSQPPAGADTMTEDTVLPPEHLELLGAKNNLALTMSRQGDLEGALELQEVVHAAWEKKEKE